MSTELLSIQPRELCFTVEARKQSICSIHLTNKSDQYVAFKVKTTSPMKYCVRPNIGIIKPKGKSGFTVIMQVQRAAPLDLQCKDKFLIQSTVVPIGTEEEDITADMFVKDSGKHIEERKLRVILVCLPQSPVLAPINGIANQNLSDDIPQTDKLPNGVENLSSLHKESEGLNMNNLLPFRKESEGINTEIHSPLDKELEELYLENLPPSHKESEDFNLENLSSLHKESEGFNIENTVEDSSSISGAEKVLTCDDANELPVARSVDAREVIEDTSMPRMEMEDDLKKEVEELKSKIDVLGSKLAEAEKTIAKLTEDRTKSMQENEFVKCELALMKRKVGGKTVHIGFPLLYVCMVALLSLSVGYLTQ